MTDPDYELVKRALDSPEGDMRAFEQIVHEYRGHILANCRQITRDEVNAEDLAQEVFVKAFFALRTFEGRASFRHWLQRIKVHHCLNHLKKQKGRTHVAIDWESSETDPQFSAPASSTNILETLSKSERISTILDRMPETLRIPLVLCDVDEWSYDEIATELGISLSAVKMRIKRGREEFRTQYSATNSELVNQPTV